MKLSPRLSTILQMCLTTPWEHIWDTCCDHGYLGQALLKAPSLSQSQIHFVDIVPHLIKEIETLLLENTSKNWQLHCQSTHDISISVTPLQQANKPESHLIIIAGVGGDLVLEMVRSLVARNPKADLNLILCPVRQLHKVRQGLQQLNLGLIDEVLVKDKELFYEIIHVSSQSNQPISLIGDKMWDLTKTSHIEYQQRMIEHFTKQPSVSALKLLNLYKKLS